MTNSLTFSTEIAVQVYHLNYGNHLGHDSLLSILQEARIHWLKSINPAFTEINIDGHIACLVKAVELDYQSEGHYGDTLKITLSAYNNTKTSFFLHHNIKNITTAKNLSDGKILLVCFDTEKSKVTPIPKSLQGHIA